MLSSLITELKEIAPAALWFSGGNDSRLILETAVRHKIPLTVLCMMDGWNRKQREVVNAIIQKHNLQVFSYPAFSHQIKQHNEEIAVISCYAIGNDQFISLIRDVVDDERCICEVNLKIAKTPFTPLFFERHIMGIRKDDSHFASEIGASGNVFKPLWNWTRQQVLEELKALDIKIEGTDTGNIYAHLCRCKENLPQL